MSLIMPKYDVYAHTIQILALPISGSGLQGIMCGYLCAGLGSVCESYLHALVPNAQDEEKRAAMVILFDVFAVTQQQITYTNFDLSLLLPEDDVSLVERAKAFSEWCEGFIQGLTVANINLKALDDEELQESIQHITDFSSLDYALLDVEEEDERAFMEITEYTRMAVLRIYHELGQGEKITH